MILALFKLASDTCEPSLPAGLPGLWDHLCNGTQVSITGVNDITILIANVVRILMTMAGGLAVIFIVVGGIFYVTAAGEPSRITRAKEIITQAVTGLIVVGVAYAAVTFIAGQF